MAKGYRAIDKDGHKEEIVQMIVSSIPYTEIARKFGYDKNTVTDYVNQRLLKDIAVGKAKDRRKLSDDFMRSLSYQQEKCEKLIEACHEWLLKPGRSRKYTLDPRADEINVIYRTAELDEATGKPKEVKKEATLQDLIDGREDIVSLRYKYSDPRALIVSALEEARKQNELIAKVTGELKEISETMDVYRVVSMVIEAITSDSDVPAATRRKLMDGIEGGMALIEQELIS